MKWATASLIAKINESDVAEGDNSLLLGDINIILDYFRRIAALWEEVKDHYEKS